MIRQAGDLGGHLATHPSASREPCLGKHGTLLASHHEHVAQITRFRMGGGRDEGAKTSKRRPPRRPRRGRSCPPGGRPRRIRPRPSPTEGHTPTGPRTYSNTTPGAHREQGRPVRPRRRRVARKRGGSAQTVRPHRHPRSGMGSEMAEAQNLWRPGADATGGAPGIGGGAEASLGVSTYRARRNIVNHAVSWRGWSTWVVSGQDGARTKPRGAIADRGELLA